MAAQPRLGRLLTALGEVDRALDFESLGLSALFTADLRCARPPLQQAARVVCWFGSRDPLFVANLRSIAPGALVVSPAADDIPVWQHLRRTVGAPLDGETQILRVPSAAVEAGRHALLDRGWDGRQAVAVMHPGAGSAGKRWPVDGFATVAREVGRARPLCVVVHEGPADGEAASALLAALGSAAIRLREPPLEALAGVLAGAALYVGNDSGVSHLAAAVGAPGVVLFTRALLGWRPWAAAIGLRVVTTEGLVPTDLDSVVAAALAALT
jgi:lipopolysaccharide heptosyltransferase III